jgi:hypothetical protein
MSKRNKKLMNRLARQVVDGKVTVAEARARLGRSVVQKSARPGMPAQSQPQPVPAVPRYAGDEEYLRTAFRPIARPAVAKTAAPAARGNPAQVLKALRELTAVTAAPVRPARSWTPAELAMLREAENISDPESRERFRSGLMARLEGTA